MDSDDDLTTPAGIVVPAHAITWAFVRSGGPGGQHVNTSSTKVAATVDLTALVCDQPRRDRILATLGAELRVTDQHSRSQLRNRERSLERIATALDEAARAPHERRPTRRTRGSNERRLEAKRADSERKQRRRGITNW